MSGMSQEVSQGSVESRSGQVDRFQQELARVYSCYSHELPRRAQAWYVAVDRCSASHVWAGQLDLYFSHSSLLPGTSARKVGATLGFPALIDRLPRWTVPHRTPTLERRHLRHPIA